jgi:hypothetical protein
MDHDTLAELKRSHPGWRLLVSDNAPLVMSFVHAVFLEQNVRTLTESEAVSRLDDHLYRIRNLHGEAKYPRAAADYLDEWCSESHKVLRKFYPPGSDEAHVEPSPATERAMEWVGGLQRRPFVATESRLLSVFELLRQIVTETTRDADERVAMLEKRKATLEAEIRRIRGGEVPIMDAATIRDRFLEMSTLARALLVDFREVEQNFRELDRSVRERIAAWEGTKGELLERMFGERDAISDSDQGKSFRAFWDFLMASARQDELTTMLERILALPAIQELTPDRRLLTIHYDWLAAGDGAQRTVARLSAQLRRFLDDQVFLENRRLMQIIRSIEQKALAVREAPPGGTFTHIDEPAPEIALDLDRPLHRPPARTRLADLVIVEGSSDDPADLLFEQSYIDRARLMAAIQRALDIQTPASLGQVIEGCPLEHGLAELITYLAIAAEDPQALMSDDRRESVRWTDRAGSTRRASLPLVLFTR